MCNAGCGGRRCRRRVTALSGAGTCFSPQADVPAVELLGAPHLCYYHVPMLSRTAGRPGEIMT
ncbi:MAG: hypothetical protein ACLU9S_22675 [Oscillospiraceae bacterium]